MKTQIGATAPVLLLALYCCGGGQQQGALRQDSDRFTERMTGSAECVNGAIYVMGGMTLTGTVSDVGAYDPSTKAWTRKAPIPTPTTSLASAVHGSDVYIIGGRNENDGVLSTVQKQEQMDTVRIDAHGALVPNGL
jgi:N-acetylneuraminic acid mutarotase